MPDLTFHENGSPKEGWFSLPEKDGGRWFDFHDIENPPQDFDNDAIWGQQRGATHIVRVGNWTPGSQPMSPFRYAIVLKSVVHIAVDERWDDEKEMDVLVWEKWKGTKLKW